MAENVETILEFTETLRTKENDFVYLGKTTAEEGSNDTKLDVNGGLHYKEIDITADVTIDLSNEAYNRNYLLFKGTDLTTVKTVVLNNIDLYKGKTIAFSTCDDSTGATAIVIEQQKSTETSSSTLYTLIARSGILYINFDGSGVVSNMVISHDPYYINATNASFGEVVVTGKTVTAELEATTSIETPLIEANNIIAENMYHRTDITDPSSGTLPYLPVSTTLIVNGDLLKYDSTNNRLTPYDPVVDNVELTVDSTDMSPPTLSTISWSQNTLEITHTKDGLVSFKGQLNLDQAITSEQTTILTYPVSFPTGTSIFVGGTVFAFVTTDEISPFLCELSVTDTTATLYLWGSTANPIPLGKIIKFNGLTMKVFDS